MKRILGGIAAIALVATGALAKDHGNGGGPGDRKGNQAQSDNSQRGGGNARPDRGNGGSMQRSTERSMQGAMRSAPQHQPDRAPQMSANRGPDKQPQARPEMRAEKRPEARPDTRVAKDNRAAEKRAAVVRPNNVPAAKPTKAPQANVRIAAAPRQSPFAEYNQRGLIQGCPPGLAKKNNGCMPPGQARKTASYYQRSYQPSWWGLSNLANTRGGYYYNDGYLVQYGSNGRIGGYIPLLGGALTIGQPWPTYYQPVSVPRYYVDYYGLGPDRSYRYANNVLYRVDPQTAAIVSVAALLTGNDIVIGQPMPTGYGVYNVPYGYRDRYYDSPSGYYRYSDGYIYRIDPETLLVASAIQLLI